jgi:hypothetical protein
MIWIAARISINPAVFIDSNWNIPELIIKSLPEEIPGANGVQNQSIYHILRYSDVLVKMITHRLNIANILPIGFVVLCLSLTPIQHEIIENRIKSPGSIKKVIRYHPSHKTIAIINNIVMINDATAQLTQAPLSISLLSRLLI